ncbi:hypothetical protein BJ508DRAFT_415009 [Ascobolus immersus RN42]|uniref:Rhodopsin domain-containing protein n=1 Tax=Ascobolus immersus RN42 TaxID=1160509 RepID=A0A3N4I4B8_ASCIM|nr:hypothetical protein BJ508DRAFT_415009 [Ascobolus immersus RN42]
MAVGAEIPPATTLIATPQGTILPDESVVHQVLLLHTILPSFVTLCVLLRLYSRCFYLRSAGWDDWLMSAGFIMAVVSDGLICFQTKFGLGRHMAYVPDELKEGFFKIMYCEPLLYIFSHFCIKSSFLMFYLRLTAHPSYRTAIYVLLSLNLCIYFASTFAAAFGCTPVTFFWNKFQPGHCVHLTALYMSNGAMNMTMDLAILTLPVLMIWRQSSLPLEKKVRVSALLLLGVFTCACSIVRMPFLSRALLDGDITWDAVNSHKWSNIEIHIAIITSCIPAIKPLFLHAFNIAPSGTHGSRSRYKQDRSETINEVYTESDPHGERGQTFYNPNPEDTWKKDQFAAFAEDRDRKRATLDDAAGSAHLWAPPRDTWDEEEGKWDARRAAQERLAGALQTRNVTTLAGEEYQMAATRSPGLQSPGTPAYAPDTPGFQTDGFPFQADVSRFQVAASDGSDSPPAFVIQGVQAKESRETLKEDLDCDRSVEDGWAFGQTAALPMPEEAAGGSKSGWSMKRWKSGRK